MDFRGIGPGFEGAGSLDFRGLDFRCAGTLGAGQADVCVVYSFACVFEIPFKAIVVCIPPGWVVTQGFRDRGLLAFETQASKPSKTENEEEHVSEDEEEDDTQRE